MGNQNKSPKEEFHLVTADNGDTAMLSDKEFNQYNQRRSAAANKHLKYFVIREKGRFINIISNKQKGGSMIKKLKCPKKMWDKLTPAQQKKWTKLNDKFFKELSVLNSNYPSTLLGSPVIAHNLAFIAIGIEPRKGKK